MLLMVLISWYLKELNILSKYLDLSHLWLWTPRNRHKPRRCELVTAHLS